MARRKFLLAGLIILITATASLAVLGLLPPPRDFEGQKAGTTSNQRGKERAALRPSTSRDTLSETGANSALLPKFDIARIDPQGSSVFAGRAAPDAVVTVLENGVAVGSAKADANGEWALVTDHVFSQGEPKLALKSQSAKEAAAAAAPGSVPEGRNPGRAAASKSLDEFERLVETARKEAAAPPAAQSLAEQPAQTGVVTQTPPAREVRQGTPGAMTDKPSTATAELAAVSPAQRFPAARPASVDTIPVPLTFVYRETEFTDDGRRGAELLLEYLKLKKLKSVSLSGHADERGSEPYNEELSERRLEAVARFLKEGGFAGELKLVPKGETEPFAAIDRSRFPEEELFQLDRRVELRVAR